MDNTDVGRLKCMEVLPKDCEEEITSLKLYRSVTLPQSYDGRSILRSLDSAVTKVLCLPPNLEDV